jgi:hypothetical protein
MGAIISERPGGFIGMNEGSVRSRMTGTMVRLQRCAGPDRSLIERSRGIGSSGYGDWTLPVREGDWVSGRRAAVWEVPEVKAVAAGQLG